MGRTDAGQRVDSSLDELTADLAHIGQLHLGVPTGPHTSDRRVSLGELLLMDPTLGARTVYLPAITREDLGRSLTVAVASSSANVVTMIAPPGVEVDGSTADKTVSGGWGSGMTFVAIAERGWMTVEPGGAGGGSTGGRPAVLINDFEFAETGSSYVTKLTSRYVRQADLPPDGWRVMAGMWRTGGAGTASLEVEYGGDTLELTSTDTSEQLQSGTLSFDNAAEDTLDTWTIKLKLTGGGTDARFKYLSIYEEF